MNKLQLELSTKGKKINMNLSTENEATIELAVLQSFAFMGVSDPFAASLPAIDSALEPEVLEGTSEEPDELTVAATEEEEAKGIAMDILENAKPEVQNRPRKVALINGADDENTLAYSTKEEEGEEQEKRYTGMKTRNGINTYQTYYNCPSCGHKGKRYTAIDEHIVHCHECNKTIKRERATNSGKLERDYHGNFFVARHGIL